MRRLKHILLSLVVLGAPLAAKAEMALPGLKEPVTVIRDSNGIPHIRAKNELDAFFAQGWVHAEDRLFQMDVSRRSASGKLAELFGPSQLAADFVARTLGLDRAAERSLAAHSDDMIDALEAYSRGVNAFIERAVAAGQLPPEYGALELTKVDAWTPLDSVLVGKGVGILTSFVTRDIELTLAIGAYQVTGEALGSFDPDLGFDGTALFFEDLYRSAPFDPASTVPDAEHLGIGADDDSESAAKTGDDRKRIGPKALALARKFVAQLSALPRLPGVPPADGKGMGGSNTWVVSGAHTRSGDPILANDMHLELQSPTIFHQIHLAAPGLNVIGSGVAGTPCVARGHNRHLAWGITNSRLDITDIYKEEIVPVPKDFSPSGFATLYEGNPEPILPVPQEYFVNIPDSGVSDHVLPAKWILKPEELDKISVVLVVPRRNNGALITAPEYDPDAEVLTALSVQSVAFSATRDLEGLCGFNRASNLEEFKAALQLIDFASQNISYADTKGNIAYFVSGEVPLREDLQYPVKDQPIVPPFFIRDGTGGHEWIPIDGDLPENQATAYEILPFAEMPQTVNPPSGIIVNANNDQAGNTLDNNPLNQLRPGGGIYYLNWGGHNFSIRAGRITSMIREQLDQDEEENGDHWAWWVSREETDDDGDEGYQGKFSFRAMKVMQADTVLGDAEVFVPFIVDAFDNASDTDASPLLVALASDPRVREAVNRLRGWDFHADRDPRRLRRRPQEPRHRCQRVRLDLLGLARPHGRQLDRRRARCDRHTGGPGEARADGNAAPPGA